jgi:excisionase family DNA binding protein
MAEIPESKGETHLADMGRRTKEHGERLCLSVPETARMLGISRGLAYELARSGQLPVLRLGKRLLVPKIALERMLSQSEQESAHVSL